MGEGDLTRLCTRFGEIKRWESLSFGESLDMLNLASSGSLKVVRFSVLGGVGRG